MKKIITILCGLMMSIGFTGCRNNSVQENSTQIDEIKETQKNNDKILKKEIPVSKGRVDKIAFENEVAKVEYKKFEMTKDSDGNNLLVVYFDFTNLHEEPQNFYDVTVIQAFQDGIEISNGYYTNESLSNSSKSIMMGYSLECAVAFELTSENEVFFRLTAVQNGTFNGDEYQEQVFEVK